LSENKYLFISDIVVNILVEKSLKGYNFLLR